MKKRFLSIFLTLCLVMTLIPVLSLPALAAPPTGPIDGTAWDFTGVDADGSGAGWNWDQITKTLTLTNFNFSTSAAHALTVPDGTTIVLVGTNTITSTYGGTGITSGVTFDGDVSIEGTGKLTVTGGSGADLHSAGLYAINNDTITVGGSVTVNANGGSAGIAMSCGIVTSTGGLVINDSANVIATAASGPGLGYGSQLGSLTINGGTFTTSGEDCAITHTTYTVPTGYKYYVNTTPAPSTTQLTGDGTSTVIDDTYKYVKVTAPVPPAPPSDGGGLTAYTVKFDTNGGNAVANQSITNGGKAVKPANPSKDGYTFAGWYSNSALTTEYNFNTMVTRNITIYAKWTENDATDEWVNPFIDVKEGDWFYGDVEYVVTNGLFNGTGGNTFSPKITMTRGMVVTVLGRLAGIDIADYAGESFGDVDTAQYYAPYVKWAADKGIVNGVGDNKFAPDSDISRQDLAVILARYAEIMGLTMKQTLQNVVFVDSDAIAEYAVDAVGMMVRAGVINGKDDGSFDPTASATRAEVAAMLHRFCEAIERK